LVLGTRTPLRTHQNTRAAITLLFTLRHTGAHCTTWDSTFWYFAYKSAARRTTGDYAVTDYQFGAVLRLL